jgi:hypothetical protein
MILKFLEFSHNESFIQYDFTTDTKKVFNLLKDKQFKDIFYSNPTSENVKFLNEFFKSNKNKLIRLYHGTSPKLPILKDGLLRTSFKTKKSLQSQPGFVYLSIFPTSAKQFGDLAYGINNAATVYQIDVPIEYLKPDKDQLYNIRAAGNVNVGETLGDSAIYGHGFRVAGDIPPYMIKIYKEN